MPHTPRLARYAGLSIAAAVITLALKAVAYLVTDSVGLLSDALESLVNLAAALMALAVLMYAARPPDDEHEFGHEKAEYFSSGVEGSLILVAALGIAIPAASRLLAPQPLEQLGLGVLLSALASLVNAIVGLILLRVGKRHRSITLEADAHHLLSDVWSSVAVLVGLGAAKATGWWVLDPVLALLVATHIAVTGIRLLRRSLMGLMDSSLPEAELARLRAVLDAHIAEGMTYHALRTRCSGRRTFVQVHIVVPGDWTVLAGHHLLEEIEAQVRQLIPGVNVLTHLEPLEDPRSFQDIDLDRKEREVADARTA